MFKDRSEAGRRLAEALQDLRGTDALVLAIPKGGIEVGIELAKGIGAKFSVLITRKLPLPHNPEAGFGAVAEDGTVYLVPNGRFGIPEGEAQRIIVAQRLELDRRVDVLRGGEPLPPLEGRTVVLTDDGIAMGSTMTASIEACRNMNAGQVIVAAPVASPRAQERLSRLADRVVVVESPPGFRAVAQAYANWYDVSDEEAVDLLRQYRKERAAR